MNKNNTNEDEIEENKNPIEQEEETKYNIKTIILYCLYLLLGLSIIGLIIFGFTNGYKYVTNDKKILKYSS
jgi:hypothetical protein